MNVKPVKTKIVTLGETVTQVIQSHITTIPEQAVVAVASKIVAYQQRRWVAKTTQPNQKQQLVEQEADWYLPAHSSKYQIMLAIKNQTLTVNAGIDESNAAGGYILWPEEMQTAANQIWEFLRTQYQLKEVGVLITDSKTTPLRWGVTGTSLAHAGFQALHSYIGEADLFGRPITMEKINIAESLAAAATLEMGEVAEAQPLALITQIPHIVFQQRPPSEAELQDLSIAPGDDVYGPLLTSVQWQKSNS